MKIDINNRKFDTALNLAEHERYYDALVIFSSFEDNYEAQLNRIGCLCSMGEMLWAARLMRQMLVTFGLTHNVLCDVSMICEKAHHIAAEMIANSMAGRKRYTRDKDKINADATKIAQYNDIPNDNDGMGLELDFYNDSAMWDMPAYSPDNFYDVNSKVYRDYLRFALEKAFVDNDDNGFELYAKRLLAVDVDDDIDTLEAQVIVCFYLNKRAKAVKYIQKLSQFDNISSRALRVALSIMFDDKNLKHKKVIARLLQSALKVKSELSPLDLCDMTVFAENILGKSDYAYEFAKELFTVADKCFGAIDFLHVCACAFYNGKDKEGARKVVLRILEALPEDNFARCFLQFINEDFDPGYDAKFDIEGFDCRGFWMPKPLLVFVMYNIFGIDFQAKKEKIDFDQNKLYGLGALIDHLNAVAIAGDEREYMELVNVVCYAISVADGDKQMLVDFCKKRLGNLANDVFLNEAFLQKLVKLGVRDKVIVTGKKIYCLDLSVVGEEYDLFAATLCSCGALAAIDSHDLKQKYDELFNDKLGGKWPDNLNQLQVAYYLLCKTNKKFARSNEALSFSSEDKLAFAQYLKD